MDDDGRRAGRIACALRAGAAERISAVRSSCGRRSCVRGGVGNHRHCGFRGVLYPVPARDANRPDCSAALRIARENFVLWSQWADEAGTIFQDRIEEGEQMTDATATLIKMEGVKKVFYTDEVETHALSEIHLEIKKGTYISIAGPSGCGKSTLLSILGLLDSPTGGEYTLNGQPVANLSI